VRGQLIILPALNFPASQAGTRTSPIDGVNLNRAFPGDPQRLASPSRSPTSSSTW
jgi:predicted deacylase